MNEILVDINTGSEDVALAVLCQRVRVGDGGVCHRQPRARILFQARGFIEPDQFAQRAGSKNADWYYGAICCGNWTSRRAS